MQDRKLFGVLFGEACSCAAKWPELIQVISELAQRGDRDVVELIRRLDDQFASCSATLDGSQVLFRAVSSGCILDPQSSCDAEDGHQVKRFVNAHAAVTKIAFDVLCNAKGIRSESHHRKLLSIADFSKEELWAHVGRQLKVRLRRFQWLYDAEKLQADLEREREAVESAFGEIDLLAGLFCDPSEVDQIEIRVRLERPQTLESEAIPIPSTHPFGPVMANKTELGFALRPKEKRDVSTATLRRHLDRNLKMRRPRIWFREYNGQTVEAYFTTDEILKDVIAEISKFRSERKRAQARTNKRKRASTSAHAR